MWVYRTRWRKTGEGAESILSPGNLWECTLGVARLDIDSGRVVDQWFGGNGYYNYAIVNPEDPTEVWFEPFVNALQRVRMDYDKRTWTIQAAYAPTPPLPGGGAAGFPYLRWFPFVHKGRRYMLNSNHWLYVEDEEKQVLRAIRIVERKGNMLVAWSDLNEDQQRTENEVTTYPPEAASKFARISWSARGGDGKDQRAVSWL